MVGLWKKKPETKAVSLRNGLEPWAQHYSHCLLGSSLNARTFPPIDSLFNCKLSEETFVVLLRTGSFILCSPSVQSLTRFICFISQPQ